MRPLILLLLTALLPFPKASGDELPPSILLPTREVTTETHSVPGTVTTTEIIDTIKPGVWYLIRSKNPLFVIDSPQGSVSIISGPSSVDGIFADGDGTSEIRVFDPSESTYLIQGLKPCKTELLLIPVGVSERKAIVRQSLTVSGEGPKPPPIPDDDTNPDPKPPVAEHVSVAIVEDTMNRSPDIAIVMNGLAAWAEFVDAGNDWRLYDLTTKEAKGKKAITDLNGPSPGIVIYDKKTGAMIHRGEMPKTFAELKALIGGLTNG